jgi:molybdopterin converting factor small subunit
MVKVKFFGQLTDITQVNETIIDEVKDTQQALEILNERYPKLKSLMFKLAVNQEVIHDKKMLNSGDELACMPPFAGG